MDREFEKQVVVVTGSGRGIGFAIARAFGIVGARVAVVEVDPERGEAAASRLRESGVQAVAITADVRDPQSCRSLVNDTIALWERVDVLVNNAGVSHLGPSEDVSPLEWREQLEVMLSGTFYCCQAVAPGMFSAGRGAIVNVASIGGLGAWPLRAAYNAAKAGVINLTQVLGTEWAARGVRVNSVSPGVTRTEMLDVAISQGLASLASYANRVPLGRIAEVDEIAAAVLFLASDRARCVTATNLTVDGGWTAWANADGLGQWQAAR